MKKYLLICLIFSLTVATAQQKVRYIEISKNLLTYVKNKSDYSKQLKLLEKSSLQDLTNELKNDNEKKTFWINVYNAFIQISLSKNPELFNDENRSDFFSQARINIAGEELSFDDIEHGIIRSSMSKISMGYVKKVFRPEWERKLRVENIDWRIHFALNCGAKSCPPVAIYDANYIDRQLDFMTETYLKEQTKYNRETKTAETVVLFSWFRGDFGGLGEVKNILKSYGITPERPENIDFRPYDWTILLNNYRDLPKFSNNGK